MLKQRIAKILPVSARKGLKYIGNAALDLIDPIKTPRVPDRRHTFIGGGDFVQIGDAFFRTLKSHGLKPDMKVLDIGCGQGRMARPLVGYLEGRGSYTGMDIVSGAIDWCQRKYADVPNFSFHHSDVYNKAYNPKATNKARDLVFPFEDKSFDFTFLRSVFTHMFTEDVEQYMSEIARTLKPGGRVLITWFLLNAVSRAAENPRIEFTHELDAQSATAIPAIPEEVIAFDEGWVRLLYDRLGLDVQKISFGHWSNPDSRQSADFQDMIFAVKRK